jgi:glycosyltransferase involved in cell wall biosynthesis
MPSPKVSIVLPTYNGAKYLRQSIESCLNQSHRNIELIIVDDASTDETPEIIKSYTDNRIKYIRHEVNKQLPGALNTGFANATGGYLTWTSDDNEYLPQAIETMLACLRANPASDFVYADYWRKFLDSGKKLLRQLSGSAGMMRHINAIGPCFLYSRKVLQSIGGFNPRTFLVEDYDYWIRVWKKFSIVHCPKPLYIYGEHSQSLKGTRYHTICLLTGALRFHYGFISFRGLAKYILEFSSIMMMRRAAREFLMGWRRTWGISAWVGVLFLPLLLLAILFSPLFKLRDWIRFFKQHILFIFKYARLRPVPGKENVLFIIRFMVMGGEGAVVLSIARELTSRGYAFHLVTTKHSTNAWRGKFEKQFVNILPAGHLMIRDRLMCAWMQRIVRKLNAKLVVVTNVEEIYRDIRPIREVLPDAKIIDILHAEGFMGSSDTYLDAAVYFDKRVCISRHLMDFMHQRYQDNGTDEECGNRLEVIHNGIDVRRFDRGCVLAGAFKQRFGIDAGIKLISFIGRFSREKNPFMFVDIARAIHAVYPNEVRFVMAGDGSEMLRVRERIAALGLQDYIVLPGLVEKIPELLADTHTLLVVSRSEGIPFVLIEAMAMGVPVISTDVGAVSEVIGDGKNGYLINAETDVVEIFQHRIQGLISDENLYQRMAFSASQAIQPKFSLQTMGDRYDTLFRRVLI